MFFVSEGDIWEEYLGVFGNRQDKVGQIKPSGVSGRFEGKGKTETG